MAAIITLLTDFGLQDAYVGVMKGAIARINPAVQVIDLSHGIPPQNISAASFCLASAFSYFPVGTVHLGVVDPGVGSARKSVAIKFAQGYVVAPDNGLCSHLLQQYPAIAVVNLTNFKYWLTPSPSKTFHGRDIFAPVAAHLAGGSEISDLGEALTPDSLVTLPALVVVPTPTGLLGKIQYIDHFGNLVTNISGDRIAGKVWYLKVKGKRISYRHTYGGVPAGQSIALVGSHGYIEIATNQGNASEELGCSWGDAVEVTLV
jgi:S-adenosylmethionine hydrolase